MHLDLAHHQLITVILVNMKLLNWSIFPYICSVRRMNLLALWVPHNPGLAWSSLHAIHAHSALVNANISQGTKAGVRVVSESSRSVHIVNDQANWIPLISHAHAWWISSLLLHRWQGKRKNWAGAFKPRGVLKCKNITSHTTTPHPSS